MRQGKKRSPGSTVPVGDGARLIPVPRGYGGYRKAERWRYLGWMKEEAVAGG